MEKKEIKNNEKRKIDNKAKKREIDNNEKKEKVK